MFSITQTPHEPCPGPYRRPANLEPSQDQQLTVSAAYLGRALAHDLNNLLTVIRGQCALLAQAEPAGAAAPQRLGELLQASDQALVLARQLQGSGSRAPAEPCTMDLNEVLLAMRSLVHSLLGGQQELVLELAEAPCPVRVGPGQVERVLVNLTVNAPPWARRADCTCARAAARWTRIGTWPWF